MESENVPDRLWILKSYLDYPHDTFLAWIDRFPKRRGVKPGHYIEFVRADHAKQPQLPVHDVDEPNGKPLPEIDGMCYFVGEFEFAYFERDTGATSYQNRTWDGWLTVFEDDPGVRLLDLGSSYPYDYPCPGTIVGKLYGPIPVPTERG